MPHYSFRGTEDSDCKRCLITATKTPIGWVRKVASGYGYRTSETEPWIFGPKLRGEAAAALYSIASQIKV